MAIYRGARKYAVTMGNLEISTGNQNLGLDTSGHHGRAARRQLSQPPGALAYARLSWRIVIWHSCSKEAQSLSSSSSCGARPERASDSSATACGVFSWAIPPWRTSKWWMPLAWRGSCSGKLFPRSIAGSWRAALSESRLGVHLTCVCWDTLSQESKSWSSWYISPSSSVSVSVNNANIWSELVSLSLVALQAGSKENIVPTVKILGIEVQFGVRNVVKKVPGFLRCFPNLETLHVQVNLVNFEWDTLAALAFLQYWNGGSTYVAWSEMWIRLII